MFGTDAPAPGQCYASSLTPRRLNTDDDFNLNKSNFENPQPRLNNTLHLNLISAFEVVLVFFITESSYHVDITHAFNYG